MSLKHTFNSGKTDGGDATLVQPSNWNAEHTVDNAGMFFTNRTDGTVMPTPGSGLTSVGVCTKAGLPRATIINDVGFQTALQSSSSQNITRYLVASNCGGNTYNSTLGVFAASGVLGYSTPNAGYVSYSLPRFNLNASLGYIYQGVGDYKVGSGPGGGFIVSFIFSSADSVTDCRKFLGLSSSTSAPTNVEPNTLTNTIGVGKLSTSSNLHIFYGGSSAQTAIDLGASFPIADTGIAGAYRATFYSDPTVNNVVKYTVEMLRTGTTASGTLTGTAGVALPATTTFLALRCWSSYPSVTQSILSICSIYTEQFM